VEPSGSIFSQKGEVDVAYGSWLKVYASLPSHIKTLQLAEFLDVEVPHAVGHLVCLWLWALDSSDENGVLEGATPLVISRAAQWEHDPQEFVAGLLKTRFLERDGDGYKIRNWSEYGGQLAKTRERDRLRKESLNKSERRSTQFQWNSNGNPIEIPRNSDGISTEIHGKLSEEKRREEKRREEVLITSTCEGTEGASGEAVPPVERVPYREIMEAWNSIIGSKGRPAIRGITDQRKVKLKRLWRNQGENGDFSKLETWRQFFEYIAERCSFLMNGSWFGFDWILGPSNFQKILEGNYEDPRDGGRTQWNQKA